MISFPTHVWIEELKLNYQESTHVQGIILALIASQQAPRNYSVQQGLLLKKGKLVIIHSSKFHQKYLNHIHANPKASHVGYYKILQRARAKLDFTWLNMKKDIKKLGQECQVCQMNKYEKELPPGLLQLLSTPHTP